MKLNVEESMLERIEEAAREGAKAGVQEALKGKVRVGKSGFAGGILKKYILLIVIVIVAVIGINQFQPFQNFKDQFSREKNVEEYDLTFENNGFFGYKAADFYDVILGDSSKLKKLEVFSQDMSQMVELKKAGLAKLKLFSKSKFYTYYGTATYTVDLGKLNQDSIELDEETQTVILKIPHSVAKIDIPLEKMEIGDTKKGLLSFGELSANDEESKKLYTEAKKHMKEKLEEDNIQEQADRMAKLSVWEVYQPMIKGVAKGYSLEVQFVE